MIHSLRWSAGLTGAILAVAAAQGGVFEDIYRGLDLITTPSGFPILRTADGTAVNGQRAGRLRIVPDSLGQGYSLEIDRAFGNDSSGRPETFDLGPVDLTLQGSTQTTAGFTRRGFLIGTLDMNATNLSYSLRAKSGVQNTQLNGQLNASTQVEINQFGFYTLNTLITNNNSQLSVDGVVVDDFVETDFGVGPIAIEGNIYVDLIASLLSSFGVDTSVISTIFPRSPIDQLNDAFQSSLLRDSAVAGLLLAGDGSTDLIVGPLPTSATGLTPAQTLDLGAITAPSATLTPGAANAPEPFTAGMLLLGGGAWLAFGRRR